MNKATFCSILAAGGVIGTAVTAAMGTPKAIHLLNQAKYEKGVEKLPFLDAVKIGAKAYLPSAAVAGATIGLIFASDKLNKRTQKILLAEAAAALATKTEGFRQTLLTDKDLKEDEYLFIEETFGFPFVAKMSDVFAAEERIKQIFADRAYANLIDVYKEFDILAGVEGEDQTTLQQWGWSVFSEDDRGFTDINFVHEAYEDNGTHYILIGYENEPIMDYFKALWG